MREKVFPMGRARQGKSFARRAWSLIHPYWHSEEWVRAWLLLISILLLSFANVGMAVLYNQWNRNIYNALESRNAHEFGYLLIVFLGIAVVTIVFSAYAKYLTGLLTMRWRRWLFEGYADAWLVDGRHYKVQLQTSVDNPDQRLSEDVQSFVRLTLETVLGFVQAWGNLVSFSIILWTISGDLVVFGFRIPGYMFWAALIYSGLGSVITHFIGRRLIELTNHQQRLEADVRFDLMRIREHGESIALQREELGQRALLRQRFGRVVGNFHQLLRREKNLAFFIAGYSQFSFVFPLTVAGPRLFSGALTFGELMQLNQAFGNLQGSLSWFIAVYHDLVLWRAVTDRLMAFDNALADARDRDNAVERVGNRATVVLAIDRLQLRRPDGTHLLQLEGAEVLAGQRVLIQGPSGCGKSTLLKVLMELWPYANGKLAISSNVHVIPQRPYFAVGTLRDALVDPRNPSLVSDSELQQVLNACRLDQLAVHLDHASHWDKRLSPGEQQRLAVARALLANPTLLILDEVTSALNAADEELVYRLLINRLPKTAIVSVGHRASLAAFHDVTWSISGQGEVQAGTSVSDRVDQTFR